MGEHPTTQERAAFECRTPQGSKEKSDMVPTSRKYTALGPSCTQYLHHCCDYTRQATSTTLTIRYSQGEREENVGSARLRGLWGGGERIPRWEMDSTLGKDDGHPKVATGRQRHRAAQLLLLPLTGKESRPQSEGAIS